MAASLIYLGFYVVNIGLVYQISDPVLQDIW